MRWLWRKRDWRSEINGARDAAIVHATLAANMYTDCLEAKVIGKISELKIRLAKLEGHAQETTKDA